MSTLLTRFDMAVNSNNNSNHSGKPSPSLLFNMYSLVVAHIKTIVKFPLLEHLPLHTAHNTPSLHHYFKISHRHNKSSKRNWSHTYAKRFGQISYDYYGQCECENSHTWTGHTCFGHGIITVYVSGKLPTNPSPKPTLTLTSHLGQNVGLGEGWVCSFPETCNCFWTSVSSRWLNTGHPQVPSSQNK